MPEPILSEDGFWQYVHGEWVPSQKVLEHMKEHNVLENAAREFNQNPKVSADGYWVFSNGQWVASEKQSRALQSGARNYDWNSRVIVNKTPVYQPRYVYYTAQPNSNHTKTLAIVGISSLLAIMFTIILIVASFPTTSLIDSRDNSIEYDTVGNSDFTWEYKSRQYSINLSLEYETYSYYKSKDHTCCFENEDYLEYYTPNAEYVTTAAQSLENLSIANGFTSPLEKAEFILAFVGAIPYQFDPDDNWDHPKYPIETLWENSGDCEDSSALYASLMESLGFRTVLVLLEAKDQPSGDSIGHAMIGIYIPNHSGDYFTLSGDSRSYYTAETTAWYDDYDGIGINQWYDTRDISTYAID